MGESSYAAWRAAAELPDNDPVCSHCGEEHCASSCPELAELCREYAEEMERQTIPASTVTISPEAVAATDAAIGKLWSKGIRFSAVGRARIESAIEASIREAKEEKP